MTPQLQVFARRALWLLPIWAAMLFLGTITHQPDPINDFAGFSAYVTTKQFLWSHLGASIAGAAIGSIGMIGLMLTLQDSKGARMSITGMIAAVAGNTLLSSIFGIAAFAQPAMGRLFLSGEQNSIEFYNQVYALPLFGTALVALLLFMAGGVFMGIALTVSGHFPRWTGWAFAISMVGYALSNFLLPIGQSFTSAILLISTIVVAWHAGQAVRRQANPVDIQQDPKPDISPME